MKAPFSIDFTTDPIEFVSENEHAALQVNDHSVISSATQASFCDFIFDRSLPLFQISDNGPLRQLTALAIKLVEGIEQIPSEGDSTLRLSIQFAHRKSKSPHALSRFDAR